MGLSGSDLSRLGERYKRQILDKLAADTITAEQKKYHNKPCSRGTLRFDSQKEARRYDELMLMLKAGKIRDLRLQAQYTLQESFLTPGGHRMRAIRYVADFAYERATSPDRDGIIYWLPVVEDVKTKATKTPQYELKKKLMYEKYHIEITEV